MYRVRDPTKPPYEIRANLSAPPDQATQVLVQAHLASRESVGDVPEVKVLPGTPKQKDGHQQSDSDPNQTPVRETPSGTVQSRSGRTLKQTTKFSPSKLLFEEASKRRLMRQSEEENKAGNDGAGEEEGSKKKSRQEDKKPESGGAGEGEGSKKKRHRSTGGIRPKGYKALVAEAKRVKAADKARRLQEKKMETDPTSDSSSATEDEETESESQSESEQDLNGFHEDVVSGKNEKDVADKGNKTSRRRGTRMPAADDRVGLRDDRSKGQGGTVNLAQLAMQFENMDKLRALIRGKDPVPVLPLAPDPKDEKPKEEKLSMKEMFSMFTDFARAVREPVAAGPTTSQVTAPAASPPASAPPVPPTPPLPPAAAPVAASPLTIENFVALMQAFQQNLK